MFVDAAELQMVAAIDRRRSIADIVQGLAGAAATRGKPREQACSLFQRLWWHDQVVFDNSCEKET